MILLKRNQSDFEPQNIKIAFNYIYLTVSGKMRTADLRNCGSHNEQNRLMVRVRVRIRASVKVMARLRVMQHLHCSALYDR